MSILYFLIPLNPLQTIFFVVILSSIAFIVKNILTNANEESWEKNWNQFYPNDDDQYLDFDLGHGSVFELAQSVSTPYEKIAEYFPGILLIIGLLGTFIGLGLALNEAGAVLQQSNGGGMGDSMTKMMEMIGNLGTKFKTSTWGILGYLLFKYWYGKKNLDNLRIVWTFNKIIEIEKGKKIAELKQKKDSEEYIQKINQSRFEAIINSSNQIIKILSDEKTGLLSYTKELVASNRVISSNGTSILTAINEGNNNASNHYNVFNQFQDTFNANIAYLAQAANQMQNGAIALNNGITAFTDRMENSITNLQNNLADNLRQSSEQISTATGNINTSLEAFNRSMNEALTNLQAAVQNSLTQINDDFTKNLAESGTQLSQATENISQSVQTLNTGINGSLNTLNTALTGSLDTMKKDLNENMTASSNNIKTATDGITLAINNMSIQLKETLDKVNNSIATTEKHQTNLAASFKTSSDTLNVNVETMTGNMGNLMSNIELGLSAISDKRQQLADAIAGIKNLIEELGKITVKLNSILPN